MRAYSNFLESRSMRRKLFCCDHHHKKRWGFIHSCPAQPLHRGSTISGWFTGPAEHFQTKWRQIYVVGGSGLPWPIFGTVAATSPVCQRYHFHVLFHKFQTRQQYCFWSCRSLFWKNSYIFQQYRNGRLSSFFWLWISCQFSFENTHFLLNKIPISDTCLDTPNTKIPNTHTKAKICLLLEVETALVETA